MFGVESGSSSSERVAKDLVSISCAAVTSVHLRHRRRPSAADGSRCHWRVRAPSPSAHCLIQRRYIHAARRTAGDFKLYHSDRARPIHCRFPVAL